MVVVSVQDIRAKKSMRPLPRFYQIDPLLSKKSSKRGLTRRPLFLVRVESLVRTVEMIGPSRSARDALPRVRRCTCSTLLFASANALLRYRS